MGVILYFILLGVLLIASLVIFFILKQKNKAISNKKVILSYLGFTIVITLVGLVGLIPGVAFSMTYFILFQLFFLSLGFVALLLLAKKIIGDIEENKLSAVLFVAINAFLGMIGFGIVFYMCSTQPELAPYYAMSIFTFLLPSFFAISLSIYREIPHPIFKVWYYPLQADEIDFDKIDTSVIYMLELEYSKSLNDPRLTNTKLRAPVAMKFGDWFRSFIENYNYKYDTDPIQYLDEVGTPLGWIFYVKPSFLGTPKYIDPDISILDNKLGEKKAILARRVKRIDDSND